MKKIFIGAGIALGVILINGKNIYAYDNSSDIIQKGNEWVYVKNGVPQYDYTGIRDNCNGWWRVENGVVNFDYTGLADNENGRFYIEDGRVNFDFTGIMQDGDNLVYIEKSTVRYDYTGIKQYYNEWLYIKNGVVDYSYTGIAENENGWWRVEGGKVNFNYNGLADNENGRFYIVNGRVNFDYTDIIPDGDYWVYVENSKVRYDYTGIRENINGWWRIESGIVNFKFKGIAANENGEFFIKNGKVDFSYTGTINQDDYMYSIRDGRVISKDNISEKIMGVDVSHHNNDNGEGVINWAEVANAGYKFAMVKVAGRSIKEDGGLYTDDYYDENIRGALANGLQVGVYFFSQAMSVEEAVEEANYICDLIAGYNITYPVVFDWETTSGYRTADLRSNSELRTAMSIAFCDTVKSRGYDPMIYINKHDYLNYVDTDKLSSNYDIWLAWYWDAYYETGRLWADGDKVPDIGYRYRIWQYTSTASVPGIAGGCDVNIAYGTR